MEYLNISDAFLDFLCGVQFLGLVEMYQVFIGLGVFI